MNTEKLMLVDCDGVLLDWELGFTVWMEGRGYVRKDIKTYDLGEIFGVPRKLKQELVCEFNETMDCNDLPFFRDALTGINKLHFKHGYVFDVITSFSHIPEAVEKRVNALNTRFGETVFRNIVCLPTGADKHEALEPYRDSGLFWVEDKPENAVVGAEMGLSSLLLEHSHSADFSHPSVIKVKNWRDIISWVASANP
jgi:hypothetical protein